MSTQSASAEQHSSTGDSERLDRTQPRAAPREMPARLTSVLGLFLLALGFSLLYGLVAIWPAVEAATDASPGPKTVSVFGISFTTSPDTALILLVVLASSLGSYVHAATSFTDYVGNRRLASSWAWWYVLRVSMGGTLALLFYFAVRGGFFGVDTTTEEVNPYGVAALAGLVGLFSKQATDKLREIFDTLFRVAPGYGDDARGDSIANPVPEIAGVEPPTVAVGTSDVVLRLKGKGFVAQSVVRVSRQTAEGPVVLERDTAYVGPTELTIRLATEDVEAPGGLEMTVFNPQPGGGSSGVVTVDVTPPENG
jgi:hypothetical protein